MADTNFVLGIVIEAVDNATATLKKAGKSFSGFDDKLKENIKSAGRWGAGIAAAVTGIGALAVKKAAEIETMTVAFESLTGSSEQADKTMKGLIQFTKKTPFQLEGVAKSAKQLLAFGVTTDELEGKLKFLGDIAAGANVPLSDMASIFGKSKTLGKAYTEELKQLGERGVPIFDVLAKRMGVAKSEIFDMASKGEISFEILEAAMISMTQEGGVFVDQTKKQSETINGLFSTLRDAVGLSLAEVGLSIAKNLDLSARVNQLTNFIDRMASAFSNLSPKAQKWIFIIGGGIIALGALAAALGVIVSIAPAIAAGFALMTGPIGLIITAIGLLALAWSTNFLGIRDITDAVVGSIVKAYTFLKETTVSIWDGMKNFVSSAVDFIVSKFQKVISIVSKVSGFIGGVKGAIGMAGAITGAIQGPQIEARAKGGPVTARKPFLVGERGPELFVPRGSGSIVPNDQMGGQNLSFDIRFGDVSVRNQGDAEMLAQTIMARVKNELRLIGRGAQASPLL